MKIVTVDDLIYAKNKIRELIKEASFAAEVMIDNEGSTHPSDIMSFENAKLYEKQMLKEIKEIHIALMQYRGFAISPEKN